MIAVATGLIIAATATATGVIPIGACQMSERENNQIIEFLRGCFARLDDRLDRIDNELDEVITRLELSSATLPA
jgi:hypothetical protein